MSAIVGERDRLLEAAVDFNLSPRQGKDLSLQADASQFHIDVDGAAFPAFIEFTAHKIDLAGVDNWVASNGATLTGSGLTRRLYYAAMPGATTTVTLTTVEDGQIYTAKASASKVRDGATGEDGDPADITPEALLTSLENRITESQLFSDLKDRIDLVDGPSSNPFTVQGRIKKEADLRVDAINAEVAERIAAIDAEAAARTTFVKEYALSKEESASALAIKATVIKAEYTAYADATRAQAVSVAAADVRAFTYSFGDIDLAEAAQTSSITSAFKSYADGAAGQALTSAKAFVQGYGYTTAAVDHALAVQADTLRAEFTQSNGVTVAYLNNYYLTSAQTNAAISNATQTLSTTVGQHTATLQTQSQSLDGLSTQLTVKSDINGYITGYGFASSANNGNPTSAFIINAGAFAVVAPGAAPRVMFTVGLVNGVAQMVLRGDALFDGAVTARTLRIGSFDNIFPDPLFNDLGWWNRTGSTVGRFNFAGNGWKNSCSLYMFADGGVHHDTETGNFPLEGGATYRIEMQVSLSSDFSGWLSALVVVSGVEYLLVGAPQRGNWSFGEPLPFQFDSGAPKGLNSFSMTYAAPNNSTVTVGRFRLRNSISAGSAEIGGISITRMSDNTLITDEGITTPKLAARAVVAEKIETDAVTTRTIKAQAVIAESIIANGTHDH